MVRGLAERHGGGVRFEETTGGGARVIVTLATSGETGGRVAASPDEPPHRDTHPGIRGYRTLRVSPRILLVEDNRDLAFGLQRNLEFEGYAVEVAEDGPTGLARSPKITSS